MRNRESARGVKSVQWLTTGAYDDDWATKLSLAARLGLRPVEWIHSYADPKTRRDIELPLRSPPCSAAASVTRRCSSPPSDGEDDADRPFALRLIDLAVQAGPRACRVHPPTRTTRERNWERPTHHQRNVLPRDSEVFFAVLTTAS